MNYTQEEIDNIVLSKNLNEFYFAIIENRKEELTDKEYNRIKKNYDIVPNEGKETADKIFDFFKGIGDSSLLDEVQKLLFSFSRIRHIAVLTIVGDEAYDIIANDFEDLKRNKIVRYNKVTDLYNESNARVRYYEAGEEPGITKKCTLLDVDDPSLIDDYCDKYLNKDEENDLTYDFFYENLGKKFTLKMN